MDKNSIYEKADKFKIEIRKKEYNKKFAFRRKRILRRMTKGDTSNLNSEKPNQDYKIFFNKLQKEIEIEINKGDYNKIRVILEKIRTNLSTSRECLPYEEFYDTKLINYIFTILEQGDYYNQVILNTEVLWILSNLTAAPPEFNITLLKFKVFDIFKHYLNSNETDYIEHIVWTMSNFIEEGEVLKIIYDKKIFPILFDCFDKFKQINEIRYVFAWFFSNCLRRCAFLPHSITDKIIELFRIFLRKDESENNLVEILWGFCFYLDKTKDEDLENGVSRLANIGLFPLISGYLKTNNKNILRPLLNIVGRASYVGNDIIKLFYNEEFKNCIVRILDDTVNTYRYDTIWVLNNILTDNEDYFNDFMYKEFIFKIVQMIKNDTSSNCKNASLDLLFSIIQYFPRINDVNTVDNFNELKYFLKDYGILDLLMENFEVKNKKIILKSLQIIDWLLRYEIEITDVHDILLYLKNHYNFEKLFELQNLKDNEIYKQTKSLLQKYF